MLSRRESWFRESYSLRLFVFLFQAEDGIRDLVRSRGLGDVYKRQGTTSEATTIATTRPNDFKLVFSRVKIRIMVRIPTCLLYTSDAADERSSVDLGGRRIIKKKKNV